MGYESRPAGGYKPSQTSAAEIKISLKSEKTGPHQIAKCSIEQVNRLFLEAAPLTLKELKNIKASLSQSLNKLKKNINSTEEDRLLKAELKEALAKIKKLEVVLKLQANYRARQARHLTVLPKEIRSALKAQPAFQALPVESKKSLSLAVAVELHRALDDPSLHGRVLYFGKKGNTYILANAERNPSGKPQKLDENPKKGLQADWSFWITIKPEKTKAVISLNQPKSNFAEGGYKKINKGIRIELPLQSGLEGRLSVVSSRAVGKPIIRENEILADIESSVWMHHKIFETLKDTPARITEPPEIRTHNRKKGGKSVQLDQALYDTDLSQLLRSWHDPLNYEAKLSMKEEDFSSRLRIVLDLFETVAELGEHGIFHRDLRPENILLREESDGVHAYLNDFDISLVDTPFQSPPPALLNTTDIAGQRGYAFHSTDVIALLNTSICIVFNSTSPPKSDIESCWETQSTEKALVSKLESAGISIKNNWNPLSKAIHIFNKKKYGTLHGWLIKLNDLMYDPAYSPEQQLLIKWSYLETFAKKALLELYFEVKNQEKEWETILHASTLCYWSDMSLKELINKYSYGSQESFKEFNSKVEGKIEEFMMKQLEPFRNRSEDYGWKGKTAKKFVFYLWQKRHELQLSPEERKKLIELWNFEYPLVFNIQATLQEWKSRSREIDAQPEMIANLLSSNPEDRAKGRKTAMSYFPTARDLLPKLMLILEDYLEGWFIET